MKNISNSDKYFYCESFSSLGEYFYRIAAEDTSNNSIFSDMNIITIEDIKITDLEATPKIQEIYKSVNISCKLNPISILNDARVIVTDENELVIINKTMNHIDNTDIYYYNTSYDKIGKYHYYIFVKDNSNNNNISDSKYFIIANPEDIFTYQFKIGSNWFTITKDLEDYRVKTILEDIPLLDDTIFWFDGNFKWRSINSNFELIPGQSYMIYCQEKCSLKITGENIHGKINLSINAPITSIGWFRQYITDAETLGQYIPGCSIIYKWDLENQEYIEYSVGSQEDNFEIIYSDCLLLEVNQSSNWDGTSGYYEILETTLNIEGNIGQNNWYINNVSIILTVNDYSILDKTFYKLNDNDWKEYINPIEIKSDGIFYLQYYSTDLFGFNEDIKNITFKVDKTNPMTKYAIEGSEENNGWFNDQVILILIPKDNNSGIKSTFYVINDIKESLYQEPIILNEPGIHIIKFYSIDRAGNIETIKQITIKIDNNPPLTKAILPKNKDPIFFNSITIRLDTKDDLSGVENTYFRLSRNGLNNKDWSIYNDRIEINENGKYILEFYSIDNAGNIEVTQEVEFIVYIRDNPYTIRK